MPRSNKEVRMKSTTLSQVVNQRHGVLGLISLVRVTREKQSTSKYSFVSNFKWIPSLRSLRSRSFPTV